MNNKIKKVIPLLCITALNFLIPIVLVANSKLFYNFAFHKYSVYEIFNSYSIDKSYAEKNFNELLKYISLRTNKLPSSFYSATDILHMHDVRNILTLVYVLMIICILTSIYFILVKKINLSRTLKRSSIISLTIIVSILIFMITTSFDFLFTLFHKLLFRNDYWLLDPDSSNLIKFFPTAVFELQGIIITCIIIFLSLIELISSLIKDKNAKLKKY